MTKITFTHYLYRGRNETECEVEVTYNLNLRTREATDIDAGWNCLHDIPGPEDFTDSEWDSITQAVHDRVDQDIADEAGALADYRYEEYRDRKLMEKFDGK